MFCVKCGTKNSSAAFCVNCGAPLESVGATSSTQVSQSTQQSESQSSLDPKALLKKPIFRVGAAVAVALAIVLVIFASGIFSPNPLAQAYDECGLESVEGTELADGGKTLLVDTMGEDEISGASYFDYQCVLTALDTPTRITNRMGETSSLDGQQTDSADGLTYFWKYHPDDGIRLTVSRD
jgi:hypothetical protein